MPQIPLDCPHCQTKNAGFQGNYYVPIRPGEPTRVIMLLQCQICGNGIVAVFLNQANNGGDIARWVQGQAGMNPNIKLLETFPKPVAFAAPQHTPDNAKSFYLQGMDNIARNFDAAGTMFRKSLDAALKKLDPSGKGTLEKRINCLPPETGVTPAMKEWAHEIRHLGNDAAHDEDPFTETEAKSLQSFTELFLTYAFTLPGMLLARKPASPSPTP